MKKMVHFYSVAWLIVLLPYLYLFSTDFGFLRFDDEVNLVNNDRIKELSWENLKWMFTNNVLGVYEPISWLLKSLVIHLFGFSAKVIHLSTLVVHILNTYLLFQCAKLVLAKVLPHKNSDSIVIAAAIVSLIFAVHPLRVEVVAWASGQSYAVGAFFFLVTINLYLKYCEHAASNQPRFILLGLCVLSYTCAIFGKSAMVLLPAWLVLIDYFVFQRRDIKKIFLEKSPFLLVMVATIVIVALVNEQAMGDNHVVLSWPDKFGSAVLAIVIYPLQTIWPINLTPHYAIPQWSVSIYGAGAVSALLASSLIAVMGFRVFRTNPWPIVTFFAYSVMLLPVLGFVQHGNAVLVADRYTYISTIPFYIFGAALGLKFTAQLKHQSSLKTLVILALVILTALTARQVKYWENDFRLWHRALEIQPHNGFAGNNLGFGYWLEKDYQSAQKYLERAYSFEPFNDKLLINLGVTYYELNRCDKAVEMYTKASKTLHSKFPDLYNNLGNCYIRMKEYENAVPALQKALELNPNHPKAGGSLQRVTNYLNKRNAKQ